MCCGVAERRSKQTPDDSDRGVEVVLQTESAGNGLQDSTKGGPPLAGTDVGADARQVEVDLATVGGPLCCSDIVDRRNWVVPLYLLKAVFD